MAFEKSHKIVKGLSWLILVGIAGVLVLWLLVPQRLVTYGQQMRIVATRLQLGYTGAAFVWRVKYALRYRINLENVMFDRKPFDCDWDASPTGSKPCHYERIDVAMNSKGEIVDGSHVTLNAEKSRISLDDGHTWYDAPADLGVRKVRVGWKPSRKVKNRGVAPRRNPVAIASTVG